MVGKYMDLTESYKSLSEASSMQVFILKQKSISTILILKRLKKMELKALSKMSAVLVPGGFGYRGIEGKIKAVQFARENNIPFLGICLGLQVAVIEFARHIANMKGANSTEFDENTTYPVIGLITEWQDENGDTQTRDTDSDLGGTMRLGGQECHLLKGVIHKRSMGPKSDRKASGIDMK